MHNLEKIPPDFQNKFVRHPKGHVLFGFVGLCQSAGKNQAAQQGGNVQSRVQIVLLPCPDERTSTRHKPLRELAQNCRGDIPARFMSICLPPILFSFFAGVSFAVDKDTEVIFTRCRLFTRRNLKETSYCWLWLTSGWIKLGDFKLWQALHQFVGREFCNSLCIIGQSRQTITNVRARACVGWIIRNAVTTWLAQGQAILDVFTRGAMSGGGVGEKCHCYEERKSKHLHHCPSLACKNNVTFKTGLCYNKDGLHTGVSSNQ
jgi:hypothetical protein